MKTKQFLMAALMTMCAMTTTVFTACGSDSDDDSNNNSKGGKKAPVSAGLACSLLTDDETLLTFDFYVKYYDANGQVQSEKVVWDQWDGEGHRKWTKTVIAKLPATLGMYCELKAKYAGDFDPTVHYLVGRGFSTSYSLLDEAGKVVSDYQSSVSAFSVSIIHESSIYDFLENDRFLNFIYYFDANGNLTTDEW